MDALTETFEERLQEIDAYLDLLDALERQAQDGPPMIGGGPITAQQQKILYSAVYLQLYTLVEATVTWCLEAVCAAAAQDGRWRPSDLSTELRREWVRTTAQTHAGLNAENQLKKTVECCDHLIQSLPVMTWKLDRRGGGSWDDHEIEVMTDRLGCKVRLSEDVRKGIKQKIRDDKTALALVKDFRNRLAHGSLSFTECGAGVTVVDLRNITKWTGDYLRAVVKSFRDYIATHEFLIPGSRPAAGEPA